MLLAIEDRMTPDQAREFSLIERLNLPPVLVKSFYDSYAYLLETKSGRQFRYESASLINEEWVHISISPYYMDERLADAGFGDRGVDVRISEIAWIADANS